jgi:Protein of unknown function (DUF4242)
MIRVVVERTFPTPQTDADMSAVADRERGCLEIYRVTWKRSLLSDDRRRMICEYEAPDAESVRRVQRQAEADVDRIWTAEVIE